MAKPVHVADQHTTLYKAYNGLANSNSAYELEQEGFVSRPSVLADRIFLNKVPDSAPTDIGLNNGWTISGYGNAKRYVSAAYPWLAKYENLPLTSFVGNPDETFYFGSVIMSGTVPIQPGLNLMLNMLLPLMTSAISLVNGYIITVSTDPTGTNVIPPTNYILDRNAGIITVSPGNGVSATSHPYISFWRYEGPTLRDAAITSDANGNLSFSGNITMAQNLTVTGSFASATFQTSSLQVTGPLAATSLAINGPSVFTGNLVTTGSVTAAGDLSCNSVKTNLMTGSSLGLTGGLTVGSGGVTTTGLMKAASIVSDGTIESKGTMTSDGLLTAKSSLLVNSGTLTVNQALSAGSVSTGSVSTGTLTTSGPLTANGLITATAGLSITGGSLSFPSQNIAFNDLCANNVEVVSGLKVGTGAVGNNIEMSTTNSTTSVIGQSKTAGGTLQIGSSVAAPAVLTVADAAGIGTVTVNGTLVAPTIGTKTAKTTVLGGLDISGSFDIDSPFAGLNVYGFGPAAPILLYGGGPGGAGYITMNDTNISNKLTLACNKTGFNIELTPETTTVIGTLVANTIGTAAAPVSIGGTAGATIGASTDPFSGCVISANTAKRIGLKSTFIDGSDNFVFWDGKSLFPWPRINSPTGGYNLGLYNKYWDNIYTTNINPNLATPININGAGGTTTVNGTLIANTIGVANSSNVTTVNSFLQVGGNSSSFPYLKLLGAYNGEGVCGITPSSGSNPQLNLGTSTGKSNTISISETGNIATATVNGKLRVDTIANNASAYSLITLEGNAKVNTDLEVGGALKTNTIKDSTNVTRITLSPSATTVNGTLGVGSMFLSGSAIAGSGGLDLYATSGGWVNVQLGLPSNHDTTINGNLQLAYGGTITGQLNQSGPLQCIENSRTDGTLYDQESSYIPNGINGPGLYAILISTSDNLNGHSNMACITAIVYWTGSRYYGGCSGFTQNGHVAINTLVDYSGGWRSDGGLRFRNYTGHIIQKMSYTCIQLGGTFPFIPYPFP